MKMYEDSEFTLTNGLFRGLRIVDKRSGNTIKPSPEINAMCLRVWAKLRKFPFQSHRARRLAETHLFQAVGIHCLHPDNGVALTFQLSDDFIVQEFARRGEMTALSLDMDGS